MGNLSNTRLARDWAQTWFVLSFEFMAMRCWGALGGSALALFGGVACHGSADSGSHGAGGGSGESGASAVGNAGSANLPVAFSCLSDAAGDASSTATYGLGRVREALKDAAASQVVCVARVGDPDADAALSLANVTVDTRAESFAVVPFSGGTLVVGRDDVGALYGLLEVEERVKISGSQVLPPAARWVGAPHLAFRGANLFLTLPRPNESSWWFYDTSFWTEYLDLMASARLDVLDLHGMWNVDNTVFPNLLPRFATSKSFPAVGVPADERATNVAMLRTIVNMAAVRGVRVSLMTYSSTTSLTGDDAGAALSDADLATYTREAAQDLATQVPTLDRLGFRIGEGGHDAQWFTDSLVAGVNNAANGVRVYTRTWLTSKDDVLKVVAAGGPDTVVEAKYNGEQLGPAYAIAGGLMAKGGFGNWDDYSYQDFLGAPHPYRFVFQVRAAGTHRLFRYSSYARTQRAMDTIGLGAAVGFTLEAPHAYLEQRDIYHANAADRFSPWTFRRDEQAYLLFGRLGYDPDLAETPFRAALSARVGTDGLWAASQAASEIVPWIQAAMTCGPDSRHFAPDLEWGGTVDGWIAPPAAPTGGHECESQYFGPFDRFAIASPQESAAAYVAGSAPARLGPLDIATLVEGFANGARGAASVDIDSSNAEARDLVRECTALADLGDYFAHKLRSAGALAMYRAGGEAAYGDFAQRELSMADAAWTALATDTAYFAPFEEHLRMSVLGFPTYHWSMVVPLLPGDATALTAALAAPQGSATLPTLAAWQASEKPMPDPGGALDISPPDPSAQSWQLTFSRPGLLATGATLWWKSFDGEADWASIPMAQSTAGFVATLPGTGAGALFAVELEEATGPERWPDPRVATPYVVLAGP